jgi:hypothetical protein
MSYDNWDQEWHLTPQGWIRGSSTYFGRVDSEVPRPADAIETWEQHCDQASGWSREYKTNKQVWHNPDTSEADRDVLRAKFPKPF